MKRHSRRFVIKALANESGFTLLELTTVIFIFIVLAAIAVPKYVDLRTRVKANICKANQLAIEVAFRLAYADSLIKGSKKRPKRLSPAMFRNGKIPRCPEDGSRYRYSWKRQRAYCRARNKKIRRLHNRRR